MSIVGQSQVVLHFLINRHVQNEVAWRTLVDNETISTLR